MQVTTPLVDLLGRYLDLTSTEFKLTSSNAANIDTPHYRTMGIDFSSEFANAAADAMNARQAENAGSTMPTMTQNNRNLAVDSLK